MSMDPLTLLGLVLGLIGVGISIYYGRKAKAAERARTFYGWTQLETAARALKRLIFQNVHPGLIIGIHGGGGIFAHLLLFEFGEYIPIRLVHVYPLDIEVPEYLRIRDTVVRQTTKYNICVPQDLKNYHDRHLLLVDDCAITGSSLAETRRVLLDVLKHDPQKVHTVAAVCSRTAINSKNAPDYYWAKSSTDEVFFPWGSGQRLQRYGLLPSED